LVYDLIVQDDLVVAGFFEISLQVSVNASQGHFVALINDVWPNGSSTHVTYGLLNGALRNSDKEQPPSNLPVNVAFSVKFQLHVTTYTFPKGHKLRLVVSNSLWNVYWPSPLPLKTSIFVNHSNSYLSIPAFLKPDQVPNNVPPFTNIPPQPSPVPPDGFSYNSGRTFNFMPLGFLTGTTISMTHLLLLLKGICF